jgi:hypothetical protein
VIRGLAGQGTLDGEACTGCQSLQEMEVVVDSKFSMALLMGSMSFSSNAMPGPRSQHLSHTK